VACGAAWRTGTRELDGQINRLMEGLTKVQTDRQTGKRPGGGGGRSIFSLFLLLSYSRHATITETNMLQLLLSGFQNRTFAP
jgi:hypothetical protein